MCRESVFANVGTVFFFFFFFLLRDSSGVRSPGRSTETVRFETLETLLTIDGKNTVLFSTTDG